MNAFVVFFRLSSTKYLELVDTRQEFIVFLALPEHLGGHGYPSSPASLWVNPLASTSHLRLSGSESDHCQSIWKPSG